MSTPSAYSPVKSMSPLATAVDSIFSVMLQYRDRSRFRLGSRPDYGGLGLGLGLGLELSGLVNLTVYSCLCSRRRYSRAVERRRESGERKREVTVQSEESEKLPGFVAERRHSSATRRSVSVEVFVQHSGAFCCQIKQCYFSDRKKRL